MIHFLLQLTLPPARIACKHPILVPRVTFHQIVQEVLFRVHRAGATIREIPLTFVDRKDGESKLGLGLLFDGYVMILRLKLRAIFGRNP